MEINVETTAKETIKPSSPTPSQLRTFNLSIFDILSPPVYTGALLFYNTGDLQRHPMPAEISQKLKKSLSETLTHFYPLAGRINGKSIDCNDEGALFIEARVNCFLLDFLGNPDSESLKHLIPAQGMSREAVTWPVLLVQANFFRCGGLAIAVCISHKITDAASFTTFIRGWAAATRGCHNAATPVFTASDLFPPPPELVPFTFPDKVGFNQPTCITKRFVFEASKIAELKTKCASELVKYPTRVEAVTALVWKCATKASRSNSGALRLSVLQQPVNIRERIKPLLSENSIGNLISLFILKNEERLMTIEHVVSDLRQKKEEFGKICKEKLQGSKASSFVLELANEMGNLHSKGHELDLYTSNSWCKLPLYEADFGWGKPAWVSGRGTSMYNNLILLIDTKDGEGIEAWVTLTKQGMSAFEQDQELLEFATMNPSILV